MSLLGLFAYRRRRQINPAAGSRFPPAASSFRRHSAEEATWGAQPASTAILSGMTGPILKSAAIPRITQRRQAWSNNIAGP